jgi:predicted nuclease of predicted toxin-antitoxin system
MKFLFDQNISFRILKSLPKIFSESSHVKKEGLIDSTDKEIWEFARRNNFTIVTQYSDFNDLNALFGFPPKVIWIRTGNVKTQSLVDILCDYLSEIEKFIVDDSFGCFEIIRIR